MDSGYAQPATDPLQGAPNTIVVNQQGPMTVVHPDMFKTTPVTLNCQYCHKPISTTVVQKFNCCACLLCWCTGLLCYICIQCCRGKDFCCYDATHTCPQCGQVVGTYHAC